MSDLAATIIAAIQDGLKNKRWLRPAPELTADTRFADLDCDAIDMVCIACSVEEAAEVEISDDDAAAWRSVGDVIASVSLALKREEAAKSHIIFFHQSTRTLCDHEFGGWRAHDDGRGGEQFCQKCGLGAMAHSMDFLP